MYLLFEICIFISGLGLIGPDAHVLKTSAEAARSDLPDAAAESLHSRNEGALEVASADIRGFPLLGECVIIETDDASRLFHLHLRGL